MSEKPPMGFWQWAAKDPGRLAVVDPQERRITFGELGQEVNQLSRALGDLGLQKGDAVALLLPNGTPWLTVALACGQLGLYYVPINYHLTAPEVAYILKDSEAKVFVAGSEYADAAAKAAGEVGLSKEQCFAVGEIPGFLFLEKLLEGKPATPPAVRAAGMSMNYTSGTTGHPKGVRRAIPEDSPEDQALRHTLLMKLFDVPFGKGVHLTPGPLYHTAPGSFTVVALHAGSSVILMQRWDPERALALIEKYKVTWTHMVPTMFHRLLALPEETKRKYSQKSLTHVIHAAAPCPIDTKRKMLAWWGPVVYEYYGATEGGGARIGPQEWLDHPGSVGTPWPGSELKILDDNGKELPPGEVGTIYMRSPRGEFEYFKAKEKTEANRKSGFFTVGDMGYISKDGYLYLSDRKSDMIISGGVNIYPAEIEAVLVSHPQVRDVAVFGIPSEDMGEEVKAVVELEDDAAPGEALAAELLAFAKERLAKYKLPRSVDFVKELPRQPSGKLYKRLLRDPYWQGRERKI